MDSEINFMVDHERNKLTARQRQILNFIEWFIETEGYPPTMDEIGRAMGIKSKNGVTDHLEALRKKGYIERSSRARSIRVVDRARTNRAGSRRRVPVLGRVAASEPVLSEQMAEGYLVVSSELAEGQTFALRVDGESMIDDGILPGDMVVVRRGDVPRDGDIVVALVDNETTIKRFYRKNGDIQLTPANKRMAPITVAEERVTIQGVVHALQRKLK
ncbi:MAG: transcriptional repressor LexA [Candidatus Hydrogenedentes bacterium]|nr:transcriptional repressor LexA [Candidatus Hydrogenedentota bacterium]